MVDEDINKIARSAEEGVTYPVLTSDAGYSQGSAGNAGAIPGAAPLGSIAENAIRQVLGWRPRANDPKSFVAALTQSFELAEVDGHTEWKFTPRGYAVQAELGAVTGAQASLFLRAKDIADRSLKLLDALVPLRVEADEKLRSSTTSLIRQALQGIVNEFGVVGGPRFQRADSLFDLLLGPDKAGLTGAMDIGRKHGYLGQLRERYGFKRHRVNTVAEEQNFTSFLVLADDVIALCGMWEAAKKLLGDGKFLGTLMVKLSRQLEVVSESVKEAYFAMDSVFLGAAERQVIDLDFHTKLFRVNNAAFAEFENEPTLTIAELLEWVDTFASYEGKHMIEDAGKDGVVAFASIAGRLTKLVSGAKEICKGSPDNPTRAFHTSRVLNGFDELKLHLKKAHDLADNISATRDNQPVSDTGAAKGALREFQQTDYAFLAGEKPKSIIRAQIDAGLPKIDKLTQDKIDLLDAALRTELNRRLGRPVISAIKVNGNRLAIEGSGLLDATLFFPEIPQSAVRMLDNRNNDILVAEIYPAAVAENRPYDVYVVDSDGQLSESAQIRFGGDGDDDRTENK